MCCCVGIRPRPRPPQDLRFLPMRNSRFLLSPLAAAVAAALLAGCAVGPNYQPPETKAAESFDNVEATFTTEALSSDRGTAQFWQTFADTQLDKLVNEALGSNHDLRIALTRVYEARALRRD